MVKDRSHNCKKMRSEKNKLTSRLGTTEKKLFGLMLNMGKVKVNDLKSWHC